MRKIILGMVVVYFVMMTAAAYAFNPTHVEQLKKTKQCPKCDLSKAVLYNEELRGADLNHADLSGAKLNNANLNGANLYGAKLNNANLSEAKLPNANLNGADLSGADLNNANLTGAKLPNANLPGAKLYGANLTGADLYGAKLNNANLEQADLNKANLTGADLSGAKLNNANLTGAKLPNANLTGADLTKANLEGANLEGAKLNKAKLYNVNFNNAKLKDANLSGAEMNGANLNKADLSGLNLSGAKLLVADLYHANLQGANLSGADLYHARLEGANLEGANLKDAVSADCDFRSDPRDYIQRCFGGSGLQCSETVSDPSHLIKLDHTSCTAKVYVTIGSIMYDNCCLNNKQGYRCGKEGWAPGDDQQVCGFEWNKAFYDSRDGRGWTVTMGPYLKTANADDLNEATARDGMIYDKNGANKRMWVRDRKKPGDKFWKHAIWSNVKETVATLKLKAPKGTKFEFKEDAAFCASGKWANGACQ